MDTELLRTFLEVNRTRHFARAADNLHLTQAAVSARIKQLEELVGAKLFTRERNNIQLTVTGHRLVGHAETILNTWNRALLDTATEGDAQSLVALGCLPSLWEIYLSDWLLESPRLAPNALLQVEILGSQALIARVREQSLNLALLYQPIEAQDLGSRPLGTLQLTLVTTEPGTILESDIGGYVHVEWGTSFAIATTAGTSRAATTPPPVLRVDTPGVAKDFILAHGGAAYLPQSMVARELDSGALHRVATAATFERPVFLVHSTRAAIGATLQTVIDALASKL